jgi:hypothetical protein
MFRFNVMGQWAILASVDYSLATLLQVMILLATGGANGGGYYASKYVVLALHAGILLSQALINNMSINLLKYLGPVAAFWNLFGMYICLEITRFLICQEVMNRLLLFCYDYFPSFKE